MTTTTTLRDAAALARALPCPATRGALYGLCERACTGPLRPGGVTWQAGVEWLYRSLLGEWRRGDGVKLGEELRAAPNLAAVAAWRLRQAGVV